MDIPDVATRIPRNTGAPGEPDRLLRACQEMESLFINQLFKQMRAAIPKGGLLGGSSAEEMFTSMHDAELSRKIAGSGGLGLARILMRQLAGRQDPEAEPPQRDAGAPLKVFVAGADNPGERPGPVATPGRVAVSSNAADTHRHRRGN